MIGQMLEIPFGSFEGSSAVKLSQEAQNSDKMQIVCPETCECQKISVPLRSQSKRKPKSEINLYDGQAERGHYTPQVVLTSSNKYSMRNNNINLQAAKDLKDDEFYTTYESIEEELSHYRHHFKGMVILCNCDNPFESNFCKYFLRNFNVLGLRRLICTSYKDSKVVASQLQRLDSQVNPMDTSHGYVLDVCRIGSGNHKLSDEFVRKWLCRCHCIKRLNEDGDFRSKECIRFLKKADIIVTNPPFSLFKDIVSLLVKHKKKYLLIGNQNALTYKEIFPLIQNNEAWTGYQFGDMKFRVPADSAPRSTRFWIDNTGQKWRSLGNAMWLTNLDNDIRHKELVLTKHYTPEEYPTYDTYDAINVKRVQDIPMDYAGIMGVPITIINKYNPEQFELIGEANHGSDNEFDLFRPLINGKWLFKRILIRNRRL